MKVYLVGGAVRDKLASLCDALRRDTPLQDADAPPKPTDIDYAVEAKSFDDMKAYITEHTDPEYEVFLECEKYGTIRAKNKRTNEVADFTLCRSDGPYSDKRRPDCVTPADIFTDLSRRDFTMNAIAIDTETAEIIDPHGGLGDIDARVVKCVGNARDRMTEDPLRLLRAMRFAVTKGLVLDDEIKRCFADSTFAPLVAPIAADRKREELSKMFRHDTLKTVRLLNTLSDDLLAAIFGATLWLMPTSKSRA